MHAVIRAELDVIRGDRRAIGPHQARLQLPRDRGEVGADAAIFQGRNFLCKKRYHGAVFVIAPQRFDDHRGRFEVLCTARKIGVQDRRGLPVDDVDMAIRAALGKGRGGQRNEGSRAQQRCFKGHFSLHVGHVGVSRSLNRPPCHMLVHGPSERRFAWGYSETALFALPMFPSYRPSQTACRQKSSGCFHGCPRVAPDPAGRRKGFDSLSGVSVASRLIAQGQEEAHAGPADRTAHRTD